MAYNQIFIFSLFVISIIPGENNGIDFIKNNIENPIKNFFDSIKNYFFIKKNNNNKNELTQ